MTEKFIPEGAAPSEEEILREMNLSSEGDTDFAAFSPEENIADLLVEDAMQELLPEEEVIFDGHFDPEAFLPDDPDEPIPEATEDPAEEVFDEDATDTQVEEGPSAYMENYPKLPDSVDAPQKEKEPGFDDGGEFDQYFDQKQSEDGRSEKSKDRPTRKGRPRRPKGYGLLGIPHLLATVIWLMLIVAIGVSLGRMIWVCAADVLAFGREEKVVTISVNKEDTLETITQKLHEAGLVRYPELFLLYADISNAEEKITTGSFTLNTLYDYHALVNQMSPRSGNRVIIEDVLIPEGYNCAQIFALLEQKGVCKVEDLEEYAANGELGEYWFLEGVERGSKYCLEGFLFPDTYEFYVNDTPRRVLEKFLNDFDYRFNERLQDKLKTLNNSLKLNMSIRQVVIMASIIEKEKANNLEGYTISSVFYNRLTHASSYPFLNSDATILYATEYYSKGELVTDAQINASPYNTYTQKGLPAGPIANPGLSSLDAALEPEETEYYFFIFDKSAGVHRFSKTLAEHNSLASQLGY